MINPGEPFAKMFCRRHGLKPERFSKEELRRGKTPDYRAFRSGKLVLYCEAKHVQCDTWLDGKLEEAAPLEPVGGRRPDPIYNRLAKHVHKAAQQFAAVNANRAYPNVLVFTNSDQQCGLFDLNAILTGNFETEAGTAAPIFKHISEGRIRLEKRTIDLYVWFNEWRGPEQKGSCYFNEDSPHYSVLCALTSCDPAQHRRPAQ